MGKIKKFLKNRKGDELIESLMMFPPFIALVFVLIGSTQTYMAHNILSKVMNSQLTQATSCANWEQASDKLFAFGNDSNGFLDKNNYKIKEFKIYEYVEEGIVNGVKAGDYIVTSYTNFVVNEKGICPKVLELNKFFEDGNLPTGGNDKWKIGNKIEMTVQKSISPTLDRDTIKTFSKVNLFGNELSLLDLEPQITITKTIENDSNYN